MAENEAKLGADSDEKVCGLITGKLLSKQLSNYILKECCVKNSVS